MELRIFITTFCINVFKMKWNEILFLNFYIKYSFTNILYKKTSIKLIDVCQKK